MVDIKELLETKERLNSFYSNQLEKLSFPKEAREAFLHIVDEQYNAEEKKDASVYEGIIKNTFYQTVKVRNKLLRKYEKKAIKNRGHIIWDSNHGMMRRNDYGTEE